MTTAAAPPKTRPTRLQRRIIRALSRDLQTLIPAMERDLQRAFRDLGSRAVRALRGTTFKSMDTPGALAWAEGYLKQVDPTDAARVDAMTRSMRITEWEDKLLRPTYESSYLRTLDLTADTIRTQIALAVNLPDLAGRRIIAEGGRRVGLVDIHGQTRTALFHSLSEGRALGEGPDALARRIRDSVARGRYRSAATRAYVIARTETKYAQNLSSIELYQSMENVTGMIAFDAQVGATDAECEQRNGVVFSAADARGELALEHPLGTLSFAPEIGRPRRPEKPAELPGSAPDSPVPLSLLDESRSAAGDLNAPEVMSIPDFADLPGFVYEKRHPGLLDYIENSVGRNSYNAKIRSGRKLTRIQKMTSDDFATLPRKNESLEGMRLFRGEHRPKTFTLEAGDYLDTAAPTSTTQNLNLTVRFSASWDEKTVLYEFHNAERGKSIITNAAEREVAFKPGSSLRVVRVEHNVEHGGRIIDDYVVVVVE